MSKFVKGTSILGVLVLGIGVWQLTEMDQEKGMDVQAQPNDKHETYETVMIDKEEMDQVEIRPEEKMIDSPTLRSIQESVEENEEMKQLITGLGTSVGTDLQSHEVDTEEEWKELEKDTKDKKEMIKKLLKITNHKELRQLASRALKNFEQTIEKRQFSLYKEAVASFKTISDRL
ncbi:hypothetical protein [Halobacillus karajensis]|uniref:Uncharacterized protein n=1 Tax=Halobacillus karajensis TaxID=195088 RepID=A0A024P7J7_9BACI|nr:hypothetical protein [Halobacillus karajensis]CDQ21215.1 hypothetical protein BN982_03581 [Halobacillus karajensis]CDQ24723.1 hypothetical protein BN983_03019 [Halobacillus karajensis]CDQ28917.1 hypothetical protein BN981_03235 [Halobacillus karajensis]